MDKSQEAGEKEEAGRVTSGRSRVRERLIAPLDGLPRRKGTTQAEHDKDVARLVDKLAYLPADLLDGLVEITLRDSGGKHWPAAAQILGWAYALLPPPPRASDYAQSVIRSAMGRRAWDGGYAVELLRHARAIGPPPQAYLIHHLTEKARDNRRRRDGIRAEQEVGRARAEDARWLDAWHEDYALCRALVGADEVEDGTEEGKAA